MTLKAEFKLEIAKLKKKYSVLWDNTGEWYGIKYNASAALNAELQQLGIETVADLHKWKTKK